jgi:hypothetical protein
MRILTKGEIREKALIMLDNRNCECWKNNNLAVKGRKFIGRRGVPDVIGFNRATGVYVGCEVKTVTDRLSNDQKIFLSLLSLAGGIALLALQDEMGRVVLEEYKPD